jgi:hypothetical protein
MKGAGKTAANPRRFDNGLLHGAKPWSWRLGQWSARETAYSRSGRTNMEAKRRRRDVVAVREGNPLKSES